MHQVSAVPKEIVLTPHGSVHRDCVHGAAHRDDVYDEDDPSLATPCKCPPKDPRLVRPRGPGGWIESATFTPAEPLGRMRVTFTVPEDPTKPGALIYLFPGAEDARLSTILQPVLQWGFNNRFGGDFWTIASWHCTPLGHTRHSRPKRVYPGEQIVGEIRMTHLYPESCDWVISTGVEGDPERTTSLLVPNMTRLLLFLVAGALEAYSYSEQNTPPTWSQYPASGATTFTIRELCDLNGNRFRADWNPRFPRGECGFNVEVSEDRKAVTLLYQ